jgi:cytochrome c-type biogenesis protein CcmF
MYVSRQQSDLTFDMETGVVTQDYTLKDYRLKYVSTKEENISSDELLHTKTFDVYKGEQYVGRISPSLHLQYSTTEVTSRAAVITGPVEDFFVVINNMYDDGTIRITGYVNPFVVYVWIGFGLLILGTTIATVGRRFPKKAADTDDKADSETLVIDAPADASIGKDDEK